MFADRADAGARLADRLTGYAGVEPVVIGLPRGGVPVAAVVAERLAAPLDVLVARKIGCPWQPELGLGAIAEDGVRVLNDELIVELRLAARDVDAATEREAAELARRVAAYRGDRLPVEVEGRTVIVVDDGLATGYTARAAIGTLRHRRAGRVVLAAPVAPAGAVDELIGVADDVVVLDTPAWFFAIGEWYEDFRPTTDAEVVELLERAAVRVPAAARSGSPGGAPAFHRAPTGRRRAACPTAPSRRRRRA